MDRPDVRLSAPVGRHAARAALTTVPSLFLVVFFGYPLVSIVAAVITDVRPADVLGDPRLRGVIWFTTWQAVVSTGLTLAAGLPAAYLLARFRFAGRGVLRVGTLVAFVLPTVVVGAAFAGSRPSLASLFAAHVFFNLAVVVRVVGSFWSQLDPAYEDVAAEMGATGLRRFADVLLPLARPSIVGAATLVFLFTFTSFGVALLLAGPARATIEVEIFRQTSQLLNLPVATALTLVQLVIVSALLWLTGRTEARAGERQRVVASADASRPPRTKGERVFVAVTAPLLAAAVLVPPLRLVWRSVRTATGLTLERYLDLGGVRSGSALPVAPIDAVITSMRVAAGAAALALAVGVAASWAIVRSEAPSLTDSRSSRRGSWLRALAAVPLGVSAVTVGFGYIVAFDAGALDLRGSVWLLVAAQAVVALPFVVRMVEPVLAATRHDLSEQAAALGASPWQTARDVLLPVASRGIAGAAVFAFAVSLGEFGASAFVARLDSPTMPIAIVRLLSQPGAASVGQATAMSVVLMAVTAGVTVAIDRLRVGTFGRL
ncbi:MAG TPA: iron ABC transporter permease [Actinomycetota bacterium]|nr:iron ABC transporter permease [Actinomycetota bacterium]